MSLQLTKILLSPNELGYTKEVVQQQEIVYSSLEKYCKILSSTLSSNARIILNCVFVKGNTSEI